MFRVYSSTWNTHFNKRIDTAIRHNALNKKALATMRPNCRRWRFDGADDADVFDGADDADVFVRKTYSVHTQFKSRHIVLKVIDSVLFA